MELTPIHGHVVHKSWFLWSNPLRTKPFASSTVCSCEFPVSEQTFFRSLRFKRTAFSESDPAISCLVWPSQICHIHVFFSLGNSGSNRRYMLRVRNDQKTKHKENRKQSTKIFFLKKNLKKNYGVVLNYIGEKTFCPSCPVLYN